jgi:uncharacterized Zn finger protein
MGYWRGRDDYWDDYGYERTSPRPVKDGIKAKSERGAIGTTWWSKRWVSVLESFNMGTRLTRGRSYARKGQVVSIDVEPGLVKAKVQGSMPKPYNVKIRLEPLSDAAWDKVADAMAAQAIFAAKLLAGEMPTNIEEAFSAANLSLFPTRLEDLHTDCSCPDWANPCKHIAAVYYLLAERFDEDPFLIFKLRGRAKEQIIEMLRARRSATLPHESGADAQDESADSGDSALLEEDLAAFWQAGEGLDTFVVRPGKPEIEKAVLKRLGDAPFKVGGQNLTSLLEQAYDALMETMDRNE